MHLFLFGFALGCAVGVAGLHYYRKFAASKVKAVVQVIK